MPTFSPGGLTAVSRLAVLDFVDAPQQIIETLIVIIGMTTIIMIAGSSVTTIIISSIITIA